MREEKIYLKNNDGSEIVLWKFSPLLELNGQNVLLTHGTFSNKKVLNGIVEYLTHRKYTCWLFEWRNHGNSKLCNLNFDFETIAFQEFNTVFKYLFDDCNLRNISCITHSGGGICLTISLIKYPDFKDKINSITIFACQAFGARINTLNYLKILIGKYSSMILGKVPGRKIGGEEDESYYLMRQWFNWNLEKKFKGKSGIDYQQRMKNIKVPILSVYGGGDNFIAPRKGCEQFIKSFENKNNKLLFCSKHTGYIENYSHSRILHSRNAEKEIYPKVINWIREKNTAANK
jgi:poly(3-hydroxyalkanoate) synthetase